MTKKLRASLILVICLLGLMLSASASDRVTYDNWEITAKRNTTISNVNVTGTLTVQNESGGSITFVNCSIAHLVLARSETADAPVLRLGEGCRIEDMTLLGSVYVEALPEAQLKRVTVADACDVQLDGSAEDVSVASGSIVTLTGQVQNLSVSQSSQINLSGSAEVGSAVFENGREGMPSVLKIEPYAAIHTLTAGTDLIVNGTGSIDSVIAAENSSMDMDVTITRRDSAKSDARAEGSAALNYARKELLPMVIDALGSRRLKDSEGITLTAKDLFGFSLDASFSAISANPAAVTVSVDGDQLTLTRVGTGYSLISVSADLTGYLPARTSFMVSEGIGMTPPASKADPNTMQLKLSLGNICNKTLAAGEELSVIGISCDIQDAKINAVSSDVNVARVSQVSGGSFTVTGINAGIAVVTVTATKPDGGVRYSPAVRKFVVSVDEAVPQRAQLSVSAPSREQLTKVYDGTASISIPAGRVSGIKNGDDVHVAAIAFYADKHAGTGKTVYVSYHLYGRNADLYLAPRDDVLTGGVITARNATIQAAATARSYEPGNVNVLLSDVKPVGLVNGDRVSLNGKNAAAVMKNDRAGIDRPVEVSGYKLSGDDAPNYRLTMPKKMTVTITPAVQSALYVTSAASHTFGTPYSASAEGGTGTGRLVFSMLPGGTGAAQINAGTGRVTVTRAGTLILQVTREANSNYQQISTEPFSLTVEKAEQAALSVSSGSGVTYGNSYTARASGGSGTGSVTFQVAAGGTGIASIDSRSGELTVSKAGTILITATKAEDENYLEKSSESFTVTADKAEQSDLEVTSAKDIDFDEPYTVTAAGGSGTGAVTFVVVSGGTGEATINNATGELTVTKSGTIKMKALKAEDDNYLEASSPAFTLTVHKADQADLFFTSSNEMVFEEAYTAAATGGSGTGSLSYAVVSGGSGAAAINDDTGVLTVTRAGTILIKVTRAGDDNWLQKVSEPFEITVHKARQAPIALTSGSAVVYGTAYNAAASGGSGTGDIVYAVEAGGTGEAAINASTGRLTITKAGTILLSATREADVNYLEKTSSPFTLTVEKAEQAALSISSGKSVNYGNSYTAAASGGSGTGNVTYQVVSGGTGSASINSTTGELSITAGGTILLKAVKAADDNYLAKTSDVFTLTVNKMSQGTLRITSGSTMTYGDSYTATCSGGSGTGYITYSIAAGGTGEATIDSATGELTVTRAGTILLAATKAEDSIYQAKTSEPFTLTVSKASQAAVSITNDTSAIIIGSSYTVTAAGGTGTGAMSFSVTGGTGAATVNSSTGELNVTKAGTIILVATKAADDIYDAQSSPAFTLTVNKGSQTLKLTAGSTSGGAGSTISLNSSAPGTGAISYTITGGSSSGSSVSGSGAVTLGTVGTIDITATIAEDSSYYAASDSITLTSTPVAPTITALPVSRSNSFDGNYRDQISFAPTVNNPSGSAYPVTLTFSITKTGNNGSIVYAGGDATTARVSVGDYSVTCTATNSVGSDTKSSSISIPQTSTSSGDAASGITGHQVQLVFNGNGAIITSYSWYARTAYGHSGYDNWSIVGYTGINQSGSSMILNSGIAYAGASDARSISEDSGIRSIVFTYNVDPSHGWSCLSSDVSYTVSTLIPYNDN